MTPSSGLQAPSARSSRSDSIGALTEIRFSDEARAWASRSASPRRTRSINRPPWGETSTVSGFGEDIVRASYYCRSILSKGPPGEDPSPLLPTRAAPGLAIAGEDAVGRRLSRSVTGGQGMNGPGQRPGEEESMAEQWRLVASGPWDDPGWQEALEQAALARAVQEGWIAAAALDVFEEEPLPPDSPLRRLDPDRVMLTPPCVGNSRASQRTRAWR